MAIVAAIFIGIGARRAVVRLLAISPAVRSDLSAGDPGRDLCQRHGARLHAHRARAARSAAPSASICRPTWSSRLARNPELLKLGGEQREITVMFTDVRGFTRISEQFDPHGLTRFMNRFLTPMTDLILEPPRHHRQVHGRRDHGVLERAARPSKAMRRAPAIPRSPCRRSCTCSTRNGSAEAEAAGREHIPVAIGIGLNTGARLGRQLRLDAALRPIPAWATT